MHENQVIYPPCIIIMQVGRVYLIYMWFLDMINYYPSNGLYIVII